MKEKGKGWFIDELACILGMNKITTIILLMTLLSCSKHRHDSRKTVIDDKSTTIEKFDSSEIIIESQDILDWDGQIYEIIKPIEKHFYKRDLKKYYCSFLQEFYSDNGLKLNTDNLYQLSDSLATKIFGNYTNDFGTFSGSYLYSFDRKIHDFYPITVIQGFGVVERPVVLVLFDQNGQVVNSIEVADLYGETGGCLSSEFINDSTLIQKFAWDEFGIDTLTNEDIWETTFLNQETTIKHNGEIITNELKRWTETYREE